MANESGEYQAAWSADASRSPSQRKAELSAFRTAGHYTKFRHAVEVLARVGYFFVVVYAAFVSLTAPALALPAIFQAVLAAVGIYVTREALQILADIADRLARAR